MKQEIPWEDESIAASPTAFKALTSAVLRNLGALGYFPSLRASLLQCIGDAREESLLAVERIIDNPKALPAAWGVDVFVRGGMRGSMCSSLTVR